MSVDFILEVMIDLVELWLIVLGLFVHFLPLPCPACDSGL